MKLTQLFYSTFVILFSLQTSLLFSQDTSVEEQTPSNVVCENHNWLYDYNEASEIAKKEKKMLLIFFKAADNENCKKFETETFCDSEIKELLKEYVLVELPIKKEKRKSSSILQVSSTQKAGDLPKITPADRFLPDSSEFHNQSAAVIEQPEFAEMLGKSGIAIVDYKNEDEKLYGNVVSVFPFLKNKPYSVFETKTILTLPPGTVTQRSLIYAVRVHPDKPKSTNGELNKYLTSEAESHSRHQAKIRLQGHHNWESRFHKITARLDNHEIWASEVCAESWPGQGLLESAIDCVKCWRYSSGHWSAVSAEHPYYGYDMKRGSNGIWYATGIFGKWKNKRRVQ